TPIAPQKSRSSSSAGTSLARADRAGSRRRSRPRKKKATKATRYIRPYQRTASGPIANAIGSNWGWTSIGSLACLPTVPAKSCASLPFVRDGQGLEQASERPTRRRRSPCHADPDSRRLVVQLAPGDIGAGTAPDARGHQRDAKSGGDQVDDRRHLYRLLADHRRPAGGGEIREDLGMQSRRLLARKHEQGLVGQIRRTERRRRER